MIESVFLNILYLSFPFFIYIFYIIYNKVTFNKEKDLFFDLSLFSSVYMCIKFGEFNISTVLLINIPLIIGLHKKRIILSFILCVFISIFLGSNYSMYSNLIYVEYLLIFLLSIIFSFDTVNLFMLLKIIFNSIMFIFIPVEIKHFAMMILIWFIMYFFFKLVILFYIKAENIINMFYSLNELTKEKQLYESLFKITHEIKNPLAVCKGYLEMFNIKDKVKANKYVNIINQEIDRTLLLLKDFSDISKMKLEKNIMDISMLTFDVCDEVKVAFDNNITFNYDILDEEVFINGDYNRLKQVLINVIKNAKESIPNEGVVTLRAKKVKNEYIINVKDNGVGMDKETMDNIGNAFYTTKNNGTGLGVCLSNEIIRKHGGKLKYFSKEKKGTTVLISLPIDNKKI